MKVYFVQKKWAVNAEGKFDLETGRLVVLKSSSISPEIRFAEKTYGLNKIVALRNEYVKDSVLSEDIEFKSATAAANFVLGYSINGLKAWKNSEGKTIKEVTSES